MRFEISMPFSEKLFELRVLTGDLRPRGVRRGPRIGFSLSLKICSIERIGDRFEPVELHAFAVGAAWTRWLTYRRLINLSDLLHIARCFPERVDDPFLLIQKK